jgi:hypothetical protein
LKKFAPNNRYIHTFIHNQKTLLEPIIYLMSKKLKSPNTESEIHDQENVVLNCDYIFYALDDEMDIAAFLNIKPKNYYAIYYKDDYKENNKFLAKSKNYCVILENLLIKYKKCLMADSVCEHYNPFDDSFKKYCNDYIYYVIDDKMTVVSKEFINQPYVVLYSKNAIQLHFL